MNRRNFVLVSSIFCLQGCNAFKLGWEYGNVCDADGNCDFVDIYSKEASIIDISKVARIKAFEKYAKAKKDGLQPRDGALVNLTINETEKFSDLLIANRFTVKDLDVDVSVLISQLCGSTSSTSDECDWTDAQKEKVNQLLLAIRKKQTK